MRLSVAASLLVSVSALASPRPAPKVVKARLVTIAEEAERPLLAEKQAARARAKEWRQTTKALKRALRNRPLRRALRATGSPVVLGIRHRGHVTDLHVERLVLTGDGLKVQSGRSRYLRGWSEKWLAVQPVRAGFSLFDAKRPLLSERDWAHLTPGAIETAIEEWASIPGKRTEEDFVRAERRRVWKKTEVAAKARGGRVSARWDDTDTLHTISERMNVPIDELLAANKGVSATQKLAGFTRVNVPGHRVHLVGEGEDVRSIAAHYGVSESLLKRANSHRGIFVGSEIDIPAPPR